ncbi:hypothetical protein BH09BAC3_BH09BAC3_06180 [soil metagenome]
MVVQKTIRSTHSMISLFYVLQIFAMAKHAMVEKMNKVLVPNGVINEIVGKTFKK